MKKGKRVFKSERAQTNPDWVEKRLYIPMWRQLLVASLYSEWSFLPVISFMSWTKAPTNESHLCLKFIQIAWLNKTSRQRRLEVKVQTKHDCCSRSFGSHLTTVYQKDARRLYKFVNVKRTVTSLLTWIYSMLRDQSTITYNT